MYCSLDYDKDNEIFKLLRNLTENSYQMVVILLNRKNELLYQGIKRTLCNDFPTPSQVITSSIISDPKKARSCITKGQ